jgi:hypothetical protein
MTKENLIEQNSFLWFESCLFYSGHSVHFRLNLKDLIPQRNTENYGGILFKLKLINAFDNEFRSHFDI